MQLGGFMGMENQTWLVLCLSELYVLHQDCTITMDYQSSAIQSLVPYIPLLFLPLGLSWDCVRVKEMHWNVKDCRKYLVGLDLGFFNQCAVLP